LFSVVAWAAAAIAPLPLTWVLVGTLALLFALRLYRELQEPPRDASRSHHKAGRSAGVDGVAGTSPAAFSLSPVGVTTTAISRSADVAASPGGVC
jgi:hypothetical protein